MKSLTSKFVLALLSLVLTGAALSVGVYAWFTINNRVSIDAFGGQVEGGEGLLISVDGGTTWSGFINETQIAEAINPDFNRFGEMTSSTGYEFKNLAGQEINTDSGYIWFDVWFLGTEYITGVDVTEVTFTSGGSTKFPTEIVIPGVTELEEHAANAARLSIVELTNEGNIPETDTKVVAFEQFITDGNTIGKGDYPVSDGNGDYESGNYAVWYYNEVAKTTAALTEIDTTTFNDVTLVPTVERDNSNAENGFPAQKVASDVTTITSPITGQEFTNLFKVRVFVWIEGWDQEAYNAILSGQLSVSLAFEGVTA